MKTKIILWELLGIVIISIFGTILHFTYDWLNQWKPVALFAAVNESVWEHLKIAFWPALVYSIIEYFFISKFTNNSLIAKAAALLLIPVSIVVLFYGYTATLGKDYLAIDILIFVLSIVIGQVVSLKLMLMPKLPASLNIIAVAIIILLTIAFATFTFYPPKLPIFKDPKGSYGIPS